MRSYSSIRTLLYAVLGLQSEGKENGPYQLPQRWHSIPQTLTDQISTKADSSHFDQYHLHPARLHLL